MIDGQFIERIAEAVSATSDQVRSGLQLLTNGCTIPFVARYRKDVTGGLTEARLEAIAEGNAHFTGLADRRNALLRALQEQGVLTEALQARVMECRDRVALDDLSLPYRKKRRTKATVAREKGLAPVAEFIWAQMPAEQSLDEFAASFVKAEKAIASLEEVLEGARQLLSEQFASDPELRALLRDIMVQHGKITAHPAKNAEEKKTKFEAYYSFSEPVSKIPSHRFLAVSRGVHEGALRMRLALDDEAALAEVASRYVKDSDSPFAPHLLASLRSAYEQHLRPALEEDIFVMIGERANIEAVRVFRANTFSLLMSPAAGSLVTMGVAPGANGNDSKVAVVDGSGRVLETAAFSIDSGDAAPLLEMFARHAVEAVAVGNGARGRETLRFFRTLVANAEASARPFIVLVSEAGAAAYATSRIAREELPELDTGVRLAVSIARRLQDPLRELVKAEPRHIGVGQYQHDVNQKLLRDGLHRTVVSAVNRVGVNLNEAAASLLRFVSGIQAATAQNICDHRDKNGPFTSRQQLLDVDGVGPRVFEQCAGFLRIPNASNPLDATAVHPEAYGVVERMAEAAGVAVADLLGNSSLVEKLDWTLCQDAILGPMTLADIRRELLYPGRDPRGMFKAPAFHEGVSSIHDLEEGAELEGIVTNVTDFGAFVDIGVQQDGLVHLSELSNRYVQNPREVVNVGEVVRVRVIKVDRELPRISLSIKALQPAVTKARPALRDGKGEASEEERSSHSQEQGRRFSRSDRPARPEQGEHAPHADRPDRREPRGERRDDRHAPATRASREARTVRPDRDPRRERSRRPAPSAPVESGDAGALSNTLLADQLAAWREKLRR